MPKTYCFEFQGTRETFLETLNKYPNNEQKFFYFNDYIVEIEDDLYAFGVQHAGHSGGYWFKPTVTEADNKLLFSGKIEYIGPNANDSEARKFITKIEEAIVFVILLPIFLVIKLCLLINNLIKKIKKQPLVKEESREDRLFHLMENFLNCTQKM